MAVTVLPPAYNPWEAVGGLIGTIMGKNAADRQNLKDTNALIDVTNPYGTTVPTNAGATDNTAVNANNPQLNNMGLLSGLTEGQPGVISTNPALSSTTTIQQEATPAMQNTQAQQPMYVAGQQPNGMISQGNINLANRPTLKNADGSISTVRSMGFNIDGKEVLLPTVGPNGEDFTPEQAVNYYKQTGQNLGVFNSPSASDAYAQALHNQQAGMYVPQQTQPTTSPETQALVQQNQQTQQPQAQNAMPSVQASGQQASITPVLDNSPASRLQAMNQFNNAWATNVRQGLAKMSPSGRKQYMSQILATREQGLKQFMDSYDKAQTQANWDAFQKESNPQNKLFYAVKNGMDINSAKLLLDPAVETSLVDMGGQKILIGRNKYTNEYTNMMTGNKLTADDLVKTLTPEGQSAENLGYARIAAAREAAAARGNGTSDSGKYVTIPGVGNVTPDQAIRLYKDALGGKRTTTDETGITRTIDSPPNQAILDIVGPIFGYNSGGNGSGESVDYNTFMKTAMDNGYSQAEAQKYYEEKTGS